MSFFRRSSAKKGKGAPTKPGAIPKVKTPSPSQQSYATTQILSPANGNAGVPPHLQAAGVNATGLLLVQDDYYPGDLGVSHSPQETHERKSRLFPCFDDIIKDHDAIPYLIQYLEACKGSWLIRFWLDAESFQASTWTRIRTHSLHSLSKSSVIKDDDSRGMKRTRSINQDITSPGSINSDKSAKSGSDMSESGKSCSDISESGKSDSMSTECSDSEVCDKTSSACDNDNSKSSLNEPGLTVISGDNINIATATDSDTRVREKCKTDSAKQALTLPLKTSSTDTNKNITSAASEPSSKSAISYRDITTPSPTGKEDISAETKSRKPSTSTGSLSKDNLAEKLKKSVEQDAVRIFTKYLAMEATHPIGITEDLRNDTIRKICREDGQVDPECFVDCQAFALNKIRQRYFDGYLTSPYHYKYEVELLTNGKIHLADIVYNETALFYFMEYMERERMSHLLHFVIATDNFENLLASEGTYDGMQAQEDAMVLYDKYFSLQAALPLGFPDNIRFEIEGNICREEGPLPDCFSRPRHIVLNTIEKLHFQRYLTSDVFYKYLSELVSMVQTSQDFPIGQRKRRGSESSSEHSVGSHSIGSHSIGSESISSKNTLLASGSTHRPAHRVQLNKLDENIQDLTMDPALLNPDALWERPLTGNMSLGKIDSLGQFVSSFVPDPEIIATNVKKKSSSGPRFFKSKKDKEREEEEAARKVADMILKDVTSVTQAISAIKNTNQSKPDV